MTGITPASADPVQGLNIKFRNKEDAILFAERQGYDYTVEEPRNAKPRLKVYADNFKVRNFVHAFKLLVGLLISCVLVF